VSGARSRRGAPPYPRASRLLVGIGCGAAAAVLAYAIERVVERAFFPEPNPAMLIWSDRSSFVWRAAIALYLGGAGVFGGYALAARAPRSGGRLLLVSLAVAAVAVTAQTVLAP
jgi:hypothetical protein